jgi:microcystin-dependent protein
MYGGNGSTTFALPNLMGRVPLGATTMGSPLPPGVTQGYSQGAFAGSDTYTLKPAEVPAHLHTIANTVTASGSTSSVTVTGNASIPVSTDPAGSNSVDSVASNKWYLAKSVDTSGTIDPFIYKNQSTAPTTTLAPFPITATGTVPQPSINVASTASIAGGNAAHYNLQPYQVVNYIICVQGIFPTRD